MSKHPDNIPTLSCICVGIVVVAILAFGWYLGHYVSAPHIPKAKTVDDVIEGLKCC
jgi:Na+/pantothenate symporter